MRKIYCILTCLLLSTHGFSTERLSGFWYGLYCGSPVTVSFTDKLQLAAESFSSMNMTCSYSLSGNGRISVSDVGPGMAGEGLYTIKDGTLDLLLVFGAAGQVKPLQSFADGEGNPAATHLTLSRDKAVIDKAHSFKSWKHQRYCRCRFPKHTHSHPLGRPCFQRGSLYHRSRFLRGCG